jgi:hypothetical protein
MSPSNKFRDSILKLGHDRFLQNPFQFTIHITLSYLVAERASSHKLQLNKILEVLSLLMYTLVISREMTERKLYRTTSLFTKSKKNSGDNPDYGGSKHFWIIGQCLPHYTAQHPRRQSSSTYINITGYQDLLA